MTTVTSRPVMPEGASRRPADTSEAPSRQLHAEGSDESSPQHGEAQAEGPDEPPLLRHPELARGDGSTMWQLATSSEALEANSEYSYHLLTHFFARNCLIAERDGQPAGFIAGLRPPEQPDILFVWQIGVDPKFRGQGLAKAMLAELAARCYEDGVRFVEATVAPSNEASQHTFHSYARSQRTICEERPLFGQDLFEGGEHEDEVRYRIGPIDRRKVPECNPERWEQGCARPDSIAQSDSMRMIA